MKRRQPPQDDGTMLAVFRVCMRLRIAPRPGSQCDQVTARLIAIAKARRRQKPGCPRFRL